MSRKRRTQDSGDDGSSRFEWGGGVKTEMKTESDRGAGEGARNEERARGADEPVEEEKKKKQPKVRSGTKRSEERTFPQNSGIDRC